MRPPVAVATSSDVNRVVAADFVAGATKLASLPPPVKVEVAFAGRSNVGKSSLLNAVMQRKGLVRTSSKPGHTRQVNLFEARLADGFDLMLADLPGYGYAKVSKSEASAWKPMLEEYLLGRATLRALVLLVDVRRGLEAEEWQLAEFAARVPAVSRPKPLELIVCATKVDKLSLAARKPAVAAIAKACKLPVLGVSGETGEGREELWQRIRHAALG